jgi:hypothetical protein
MSKSKKKTGLLVAGVVVAASGLLGYYLYKKSNKMAGLAGAFLGGGGHHGGGGRHGGHGGGGYGGGYGGYGPSWGGYAMYTPPVTTNPCLGYPCPTGYVADPRSDCRCVRVML